MGFSPVEVDQMSFWQLLAAAAGWAEAKNTSDGKLSEAEADDIWRWMRERAPAPLSRKAIAANGYRA